MKIGAAKMVEQIEAAVTKAEPEPEADTSLLDLLGGMGIFDPATLVEGTPGVADMCGDEDDGPPDVGGD